MSSEVLKGLLNDIERQTQARGHLRGLLDASPTTLNYMKWYNELPLDENERNIAVISSFTIETIAPFLRLEAFVSGWRIAPKFYQYSEWWTLLANPGKLEEPEPEACVILLHSDAVLDQRSERDKDSVEWISSLVNSFRRQSSIPLFLGLLVEHSAQHSVALGDSLSHGRPRTIARIQNIMVDLALELEDIHILDISTWQIHAKSELLDCRGYLNNLSLLNGRGMSVVARGIARSVGCLFRTRRKVLVVDLDNTLWGGILGEEGVDGVKLGHDWPGSAYLSFQDTLRSLHQSGVLLAICSKNEENDVRAVFDRRMGEKLSWDDFIAHRINWNNKAENLISIGKELGLGLDSFVFADDSPKECALVREILPMVEVVRLTGDPETFSEQVLACQAFDVLGLHEEDSFRTKSYQISVQRQNQEVMSTSLEEFYSSMDFHIKIHTKNIDYLSRVHELLNKTNQFNLTLDRPTLQQLRKRLEDDRKIYCVELRDRFGEHGIVAVLELLPVKDQMYISNLAISCRALGCLVEDTLLAFGDNQACRQGAKTLVADYVMGPRNMQVEQFLLRMDFELGDANKFRKQFVRSLFGKEIQIPDHVTLEVID